MTDRSPFEPLKTSPEVVVTDGLRTHGAAIWAIRVAERQETGHWPNGRKENAHLAFRRRERAMFRSRRHSESSTRRNTKTIQYLISLPFCSFHALALYMAKPFDRFRQPGKFENLVRIAARYH
jgi:transposase-like protein